MQNLLRDPTVRQFDQHYHVISKLQAQIEKELSQGSLWTQVFGGVLGAGRAALSGAF